MLIVFNYLLIFLLSSMLGYVLELFFRRYVSTKKWINPGFLKGPYLPIYGFGIISMYFICSLDIEWYYQVLLIGAAMTLVEYIAGIIFIKIMKIKLWDYSDQKWNIQGIICPLFSLIWAGFGAAFYFLAFDKFVDATKWLDNNIYYIFVLGLGYGLMLMDFCISFNLALKVRSYLENSRVVLAYEKFKAYIRTQAETSKTKKPFFDYFKSFVSLKDNIENFLFKREEKESNKDESKGSN